MRTIALLAYIYVIWGGIGFCVFLLRTIRHDGFVKSNGTSYPYLQNELPAFSDCDFSENGLPIMATQSEMFMYSFLWGMFGIARFISGHYAVALVQLFSCGFFGIWWLVDWIFIILNIYSTMSNGCPFYPDIFSYSIDYTPYSIEEIYYLNKTYFLYEFT